MFIRHTFISWCIILALLATGMFWAWRIGVVHAAIEADHIHITSVIMLLFLGIFGYLGRLAYIVDHADFDTLVDVQGYFDRRLSWGWYFGNFLFSLGILGTAGGMLIMLAVAFANTDFSNQVVQASMIPVIGKYYSMALYATVCGLLGGLVTSLTTQIISYAVDVRAHE